MKKAKTLLNWIFVGEKQDKSLKLTFEEAEKFVKFMVAISIAIGGMWYAHFKTLPDLGKLSTYDIYISASLLGPVFYGFGCFYLYGLLSLSEKNDIILGSIAHMRAAFFTSWPLFLLVAFIVVLLEKSFPADKFNDLSRTIGVIMLLIFIGSGIILRLFLANKSVRPARSLIAEVLLIISYLLAMGVLVILSNQVVPKI